MSKYHRTSSAIMRSRNARALVVLPTSCARCGRTIEEGQPFDMGHAHDVSLGGADSELRPEHRRCNRSAGGRVGIKVTAARRRRGQTPSW